MKIQNNSTQYIDSIHIHKETLRLGTYHKEKLSLSGTQWWINEEDCLNMLCDLLVASEQNKENGSLLLHNHEIGIGR